MQLDICWTCTDCRRYYYIITLSCSSSKVALSAIQCWRLARAQVQPSSQLAGIFGSRSGIPSDQSLRVTFLLSFYLPRFLVNIKVKDQRFVCYRQFPAAISWDLEAMQTKRIIHDSKVKVQQFRRACSTSLLDRLMARLNMPWISWLLIFLPGWLGTGKSVTSTGKVPSTGSTATRARRATIFIRKIRHLREIIS